MDFETRRNEEGFILPHGGYRELLSYQKALIVFDGTVRFCERFFNKYDRTIVQMVQAARSGKQNLIEGSKASGTSKKSEIKLTAVARSSLEELLEDYHDFLRTRNLSLWDKDSKAAKAVRRLGSQKDVSYETYQPYVEIRSPETSANVMICLIHQTNYLIDRQIQRMEQDFVRHGGLSERMTKARLKFRRKAPPQ